MYIYDMVVLPPIGEEGSAASILVGKELLRVSEYVRLADNEEEYRKRIDQLKDEYGVTGEVYDEQIEEY